MRIARIATLAAACLVGGVAAGLVAAAPDRTAAGQLVGTVGPGFTISLKDATGATVTHLDPGAYTLLVHDLSELHNFHLSGPGVDVLTDVTFIGDQTFAITVTDGVYFFDCDAHPTQMQGSFAAGTATLPTTTTTPPTPTTPAPPKPRSLALAVGPGKRLTAPARLSAGRYAVTVQDSSASDDLHLKGTGADRKTGVAFKGKVHWTVTLKKGLYSVFSDAHRSLARTITVR